MLGVFAGGLMIALVVDDVIYLKANDSFVPLFEREGQTPFSYKTRDGKRTLNSYWRMPERLTTSPMSSPNGRGLRWRRLGVPPRAAARFEIGPSLGVKPSQRKRR